MTTRYIKTIIVTIALLITVSACTSDRPGDSSPPLDRDWFGNPLPTDDPSCVQPPPPPPPQIVQGEVSQTSIVLSVWANDVTGYEVCIPVKLHVYGMVADQAGIKIDENTTLPWSGTRATRWNASILIAYDKSKQQPPEYSIDLIATYEPAPGIAKENLPGNLVLKCAISVNEIYVNSNQVPINVRVPATSTTRCKYNGIAN